jgi:hypothetical protein
MTGASQSWGLDPGFQGHNTTTTRGKGRWKNGEKREERRDQVNVRVTKIGGHTALRSPEAAWAAGQVETKTCHIGIDQ